MSVGRRVASGTAALVLPLALATAAFSQTADEDLRRDIEALKQGQQQIRQELAELKRLLQQQQRAPAGPNVAGKVFNLAANPVKGEPSARLTLIEFLDYQ